MGILYIDGKEVLADVYMKGTWRAVGTVNMPTFTMTPPLTFNAACMIAVSAQDVLYLTDATVEPNKPLRFRAAGKLQTRVTTGDYATIEGYGSGSYVEHARLAPNNFELVNGKLTGALDAAGQFISWTASLDSAAVADTVSLSGYEISAGHRALAISSEEVVVTAAAGASDEYLPVRINGVTYKLLLHT